MITEFNISDILASEFKPMVNSAPTQTYVLKFGAVYQLKNIRMMLCMPQITEITSIIGCVNEYLRNYDYSIENRYKSRSM